MQENYLAKWLNGELTDAELESFKATEEYAAYKKIVEASNKIEAPDFDAAQAWKTFQDQGNAKEVKVVPLRPYKQFFRIAAAIAVLLAGAYFYLNSLNEVVTTAMAERTEILLPDNSEVSLNAASEITYSAKKWNDQRIIQRY